MKVILVQETKAAVNSGVRRLMNLYLFDLIAEIMIL